MTGKIFLIADTHFNHANIIKYCHRPFSSVGQMNQVMLTRWNETIHPDDTVYFLGDLAFGDPRIWLDQLNGEIRFIRGNHDAELRKMRNTRESIVLQVGLENIMLVHAVEYLRGPFSGWVIHGHHHNNNLKEFPHMNKANKTINVSVEVVDYRPVELTELLARRE
jgi:calcineurin-like phosphoesterase family protein